MKRFGGLWPSILDRENLRLAATKALRAKRSRFDARRYMSNLEENLQQLASGLANRSFPIGRHRQFIVHDPKERIITAPHFEERVLHHAIMNVCEPILERRLISDTFACRRGRGWLSALSRARTFASRNEWFVKMDIRKYFDSISHERLIALLRGVFKDWKVIKLFESIIHEYRGDLGYGLPIGSLTSQHFANFYLSPLDRYVKQELLVPGYVRYMDDFVIWGNDKLELRRHAAKCELYLADALQLSCKNAKSPYTKFQPTEPEAFAEKIPEPEGLADLHFANAKARRSASASISIARVAQGMDFLGCRVWPTHLTLNRRSRLRFQRKLKAQELEYEAGQVNISAMQQRVTSLLAFTRTPGLASWKFRTAVVNKYSVCDQ